ncbi:hypothetical protein [Mycobacterium sp. MFM001]|uniref:CDGP domain-containing protein n=1 Tax=Mycobacterium sp. MFM001 TaxID=2049453 RepID=UPI001EDF528A|nr:hypothetical protein [Mycobacterium sp. MFM001]
MAGPKHPAGQANRWLRCLLALGCRYGGPVISICDGPVQPDGTWQRCVAVAQLMYRGASSYLVPDKPCGVMGPDQHSGDLAFADPSTHIDD